MINSSKMTENVKLHIVFISIYGIIPIIHIVKMLIILKLKLGVDFKWTS